MKAWEKCSMLVKMFKRPTITFNILRTKWILDKIHAYLGEVEKAHEIFDKMSYMICNIGHIYKFK